MKVRLIIILQLSILFAIRTKGQDYKDYIFLSGQIITEKKSLLNSELKIILTPDGAIQDWITYNKEYNTRLNNGSFQIKIPVTENFSYLGFQLNDDEGNIEMINLGNGSPLPFLFTKGDSVSMKVRSKMNISFFGRGSEKLNCQALIYGIPYLSPAIGTRNSQLSDKGKSEVEFNLFNSNIQAQFNTKISILNSFRSELDSLTYEKIYLNMAGLQFQPAFITLYMADYGQKFSVSEKERWAKAKLTFDKIDSDFVFTELKNKSTFSPFFLECIMIKEKTKIKFSKPMDTVWRPEFQYILELLKGIGSNYKGLLRDQLLLMLILNEGDSNPIILKYLDSIIKLVEDDKCKNMIIEWKLKHFKGAKAFDFDLVKNNGDRVKLNDLKGKVIIADFWFRGCHACTEVAKVLERVSERFISNKNLLFLSINVDSKKKIWDIGLSEHIYSFKNSINVSTYESGLNANPLLKFYNFTSFPQLLIIDQKGFIVTLTPGDPRKDNGAQLFSIINSLL